MANTPVWAFTDYLSVIPTHGSIRDYLNYALQCTDAPPGFHTQTWIAAISTAISSNVNLVIKGMHHPLNMFTLLVGDSGSRKTASVKRGMRVIEPVFKRFSSTSRVWYPEACSMEGIIDELVIDSNRLMVLPEWTQLHNQQQANHWKYGTEFWNRIHDGDNIHRIRAGKIVEVQNPHVGVLGCTTPSLFKNAVSTRDFAAGKIARYLILCMDRPPEIRMATATDLPREVAYLQQDFERFLASPLKPFTMSDDALEMFRAWEESSEWLQQYYSAPEHLQPSMQRATEHVLRLSAIYQASMDYPNNMMVGAQAMDKAIEYVRWCTQTLFEYFAILPMDFRQSPLSRVITILSLANEAGMAKCDLLRKTEITSRQLDEAIRTLKERGELVVEPHEGSYWFWYRPRFDTP